MSRIERARGLAAAHQLRSAATELESIRASVNDTSVRNITTLMLVGIYLEEGNYVRPAALLDEAFQKRATQKDDSVRTYFAVAGQAINGVRTRLARYRSFGIHIGESKLPVEAISDIDQLRFLLEKLVAQANEATNENGRAYDAWALKEDVLGLRLSLARDMEDRRKWQAEYSAARSFRIHFQVRNPQVVLTRTTRQTTRERWASQILGSRNRSHPHRLTRRPRRKHNLNPTPQGSQLKRMRTQSRPDH